MDNLPHVLTIKHVLVGQGLVGRPSRLEVHREVEGGRSLEHIYRTFDRVPELAKWLNDNGYAYVPGSNGEWCRL
jgi:hypothetical protein